MITSAITLDGMANKTRSEAVPKGKARNAVNVQFDDAGNVIMPRPGTTLRYAGDTHSVFTNKAFNLLVDAGALKRLNEGGTAETLLTGVGEALLSYTDPIGGTVYFANSSVTGKTDGLTATEWGTDRPPRQPDCTPVANGGMYAGSYRVAITWISDEESGTGMGKHVSVSAGGGIHVTNFPTPPSYVKKVAVYASSANSKKMYLYGEFDPATREVFLGRLDSQGKVPTIQLQTQFGFKPAPQGLVLQHYGRIYYPRGPRLYWTATRRFGLQFALSFWRFDTDIQTVVSRPDVLYVGTLTSIYKVTNIGGDEPATIVPLLNCGSVKGSETYDPDGVSAYFMSGRGLIAVTSEGLTEVTYKQVAIPFFKKGSSTVIERDGVKYWVGVFRDGTQNPLADAGYNTEEQRRGSL